jgi:hypothetical protein
MATNIAPAQPSPTLVSRLHRCVSRYGRRRKLEINAFVVSGDEIACGSVSFTDLYSRGYTLPRQRLDGMVTHTLNMGMEYQKT